MAELVEQLRADAYQLFNIAKRIQESVDQQLEAQKVEDQNKTIVGMSWMMTNMMEILKAKGMKPAEVKLACAMREAGPDKNMKRILPQATNDIAKSIREGEYCRYKQKKDFVSIESPVAESETPANDEFPPSDSTVDSLLHDGKWGIFARNEHAQHAARLSIAPKSGITTPIMRSRQAKSNTGTQDVTSWEDWEATPYVPAGDEKGKIESTTTARAEDGSAEELEAEMGVEDLIEF